MYDFVYPHEQGYKGLNDPGYPQNKATMVCMTLGYPKEQDYKGMFYLG